jgi:phage-related protein
MAIFTWIPSVGASLSMRPLVRRVAFGDGYEQRLRYGINTQTERWSLEFRGLATRVAAEIDGFLRERGSSEAFEWKSPAGTNGKFICDDWSRSIEEPDMETVRANFRQVFDL